MYGQVSSEVEINVPASKVWDLYGTDLKLAKFVEEKLPLVDKIEVVQGNGGVGTIFKIIFAPGTPGLSSYKEKYTIIDDEKRIKVAEVVEGGYLELGFTMYRVRFEVTAMGSDKCIVKSTVEYELKEEAAHASDLVTTKPFEDMAKLAALHLLADEGINA